jgi:hypothetical protein
MNALKNVMFLSLFAWARNNVYAVELICLVSCIGCILFLWDVFSMVVVYIYAMIVHGGVCLYLGLARAKVIFGERNGGLGDF